MERAITPMFLEILDKMEEKGKMMRKLDCDKALIVDLDVIMFRLREAHDQYIGGSITGAELLDYSMAITSLARERRRLNYSNIRDTLLKNSERERAV